MVDIKWTVAGYVTEAVPEGLDLKAEIRRMCKEKNAVIMAHYYTYGEIQDVADFVGDSLALAQQAAKTGAEIIVMCGVHFMGETNKIICPDKKVLVPDLNASCSLAESCPPKEFGEFVAAHPDHTVISYVNTTAAIKALTDIVVTSGNAMQIVDSLPKDEKIVFAPDRNLGNYINSVTGRQMVLWNGACHVHEKFSLERILELKEKHPNAKILVHPECKGPIVKVADKVGSTAALLKFSKEDEAKEFIVATESGILHKMQEACPEKVFIPAPPEDSTCACNECNYMKLITMEKLYNCLRYEWPEIEVTARATLVKETVVLGSGTHTCTECEIEPDGSRSYVSFSESDDDVRELFRDQEKSPMELITALERIVTQLMKAQKLRFYARYNLSELLNACAGWDEIELIVE